MTEDSTFTFVSGDGRKVEARRWTNPDSSPGGWVAETAEVHATAIIDVDAMVEPGAVVGENAHVKAFEVVQGEGWTPHP